MIPFLSNTKPSLSPLKRKPQTNHSCFFSSKTLKLLLLAFLGMTPVVGFVADIANAGISVARGNYADASINLAAAVPGAGQAVMGAKMAAVGFGVYKSAKFAKGASSSFSGAANKIDDVSVKWPKNRGFVAGEGGRASVLPGQTLDRFGGNHGSFMSPSGTPASARSLTPGTELKPLNSFEVLKPFEVDAGRAAPWFKQPGGGGAKGVISYCLRKLKGSVQLFMNILA